MMFFGKLERIVISAMMIILGVLITYVIFNPFHSNLKGCETALVLEKQLAGRDNDIPTLYVRVDESVIDKAVDNETYFSVEPGDEINYCTYTDEFFPKMTNFTTVERIER